MALFNFKKKSANKTTNRAGGQAFAQTPEMQLVSILLTSFAQNQFYRSTDQTFAELTKLLRKVNPEFAAKAAVFARNEYGMRSISHYLAAELAAYASGETWAKDFYKKIVRRPDDMLEIASVYRAKGGKNMPNAMKKGFATAFNRFDGYQLAKYRGEGKAFKLVDMVNLVRPKATDRNAAALRDLVAGTLRNTNTWEAKLTKAGQTAKTKTDKAQNKAKAWTDLLANNKMGYLALLRNLRNIADQAPEALTLATTALRNREAIKRSLVMPFQILVAMDAIDASGAMQKRQIKDALSDALELSLDNVPRFKGRTLVVLDDSGSMTTAAKGSGFGNRSCIQLGAAFAAALFKSNDADLMRFSNAASYVKANSRDSMMSIADRLVKNARAGGTNFNAIFQTANQAYDRIILLSDMQGWMGNAPSTTFAKYKARTGANPYVYSFDLAGYGSTQLSAGKIFQLAGFSDKVFDMMKLLESDRTALVHSIKATRWN